MLPSVFFVKSNNMLRQVMKKTIGSRCLYDSVRNMFEESSLKKPHADITSEENCIQTIKQASIPQTTFKPAALMPLAELPQPSKDSKIPLEIAEFIDSLDQPLPVSFNLAAYINQSESLQKLVQLGVDLSVFEKKPVRAKYILKLDFERDMKGHIQFLHDHGIEADLLGRFITKNPFIFKESLKNLEIRLNYLKSKNFTSDAISRIIGINPFFLSMDTKAVDTRLGFFQKQFSLSGNEVRYLITKAPKLVTYDFQKLTEKLFVMKEELGYNSMEMKKILLDKPKIWMIGRKHLNERFNILHNIMGISHEHILNYPDIFLSRGFILLQRHKYLVHLKRSQYDPEKPLYVSLEDLSIKTNDATFCEKCANTSVFEYNEFLKTL